MKKGREVLAWGGFVDGKLDSGFVLGVRNNITPLFGVFKTRAAARLFYADVRRVKITLADPGKDAPTHG